MLYKIHDTLSYRNTIAVLVPYAYSLGFLSVFCLRGILKSYYINARHRSTSLFQTSPYSLLSPNPAGRETVDNKKGPYLTSLVRPDMSPSPSDAACPKNGDPALDVAIVEVKHRRAIT